MKKLIFLLTLAAMGSQAFAQSTCNSSLQKGNKLHYIRQDAPSIMDIPNIGTLTPKELKPVQAKFDADVKAGTRVGKEYPFDLSVTETVAGDGFNLAEFTYTMPNGDAYKSYSICTGDTIYSVRSGSLTPMKTPDGTITGFIKPGIVKYPTNMKVGDVLPVCVDFTHFFPISVDASYRKEVLDYAIVNTRITDYGNGRALIETSTTKYFKTIISKVKFDFEVSPSTITYRYVDAEENITMGGKTYKALRIATVLETSVEKPISGIVADDWMDKLALQFTNLISSKKMNKAPNMHQNGNEWFVPELGMVVVAEVLNAEGKSQYKSILKGIE